MSRILARLCALVLAASLVLLALGSGALAAPRRQPAAASRVVSIARQAMRRYDLKAVILRVLAGHRPLATAALGESMAGVPATPKMHFRTGNIAYTYLTTVLLQLQQQGRLSLDDPLAKWFPKLPQANRITLQMLANSTSGYADYVPLPAFYKVFYDDPFRQLNVDQLVRLALAKPLACAPGTCFLYSHANFVLLAEVLHKATGQSVARLIRNRVLVPLGLHDTDSPSTPAIRPPVLHAYATDRDLYEDSTYWNASWTAAPGSVMTTNIYDLASSGNAIGTGRLLSAQSRAAQVAPLTARLRPFNRNLYYGLGLIISHSWIVQSPSFGGYAAVMAYLPSKRITIAVTATRGRHTPAAVNYAQLLAHNISKYLAPGRPIVLPG